VTSTGTESTGRPADGSWALEDSRRGPAFRAPLLQCPGRPAWRETGPPERLGNGPVTTGSPRPLFASAPVAPATGARSSFPVA
jgi:hypothetical protein